ncbi:putative quinol monooxygenase [Shimia sagamensis]|uniref:Quinol monooxygenase YgiN n=1 Tax=Shimia sagamensis TaxID=1566352 RepID=A0ABY1NWF1_9RHOB|nr:antibiotic biosynthesis monooxygenase family protein [Shimia sagamensis]SMP19011.1 Quinol monooxygenase YgiN [Shimia sagamensis]
MSVTIMVSFYLPSPHRARVRTGLLELAQRVLNDQNCLRFDIHTGTDDPGQFILFHRWETRRDWQTFLNSEALHTFQDLFEDGVTDLVIKELTPHFTPSIGSPVQVR